MSEQQPPAGSEPSDQPARHPPAGSEPSDQPAQQQAYGSEPSEPAYVPGPGPQLGGYVFQVGDIGVTTDSIVTYSGTAPLAGSSWMAIDHSRREEERPTWAIVLAIVFAVFCLLGLLLLLVKETTVSGYVEVRVQSGSFWHVTQVPVTSAGHVDYLLGQVSQIQAYAYRQGS